jgi:SAV_6107-like HEPN
MGPVVARGKRVAAGRRRLPHGGVDACACHDSLEEADVPAVASLTSHIRPRFSGTGHSGYSRDPGTTDYCLPSARFLIDQAREALIDAEYARHPGERYTQAHLAALRAAAAVLAVRARPRRRAAPTSAWTLLSIVAPELSEWAAFFAAGSATHAAVQAGAHRLVTDRDADDMVRQAGQFLTIAWQSATKAVR